MNKRLMIGMVLSAALCRTSLGQTSTLWTEDFSVNPTPTWTQTGSGIYWNSEVQNLRISNAYDSTSTFSRPAGATFTAGTGFAFSLDYLPDYGWYSTEHNFGLVNAAGNGKVFVHAVPNWVGEWPNEVNLYGTIEDSEGTTYSSAWIRIGMYGPFVINVNYDPATRTMTTSATLKSTGDVYGSVSIALPADKTFSVNQFKFYNTSTTGGGDFKAYVDNVVLQNVLAPVTVKGQVVLDGFIGDRTTAGINVEFQPVNGGASVPRQAFLASDGGFTVTDVAQGRYNIIVQAAGWLKARVDNVTVAENPTVITTPIALKGADSNGDNTISFEDFSILQNNYGEHGAAGASPLSMAAAASGCGPLGIAILALMGLALHTLGLRQLD